MGQILIILFLALYVSIFTFFTALEALIEHKFTQNIVVFVILTLFTSIVWCVFYYLTH
jgi:hypothetical protein